MMPLVLLVVVGLVLGGQVNRGIYRLAWDHRAIGPWSAPHPDAPPRQVLDRIPLIGWWYLRREAAIHGRWFWIRPLLIELAMGVGLAVLYWYEVDQAAIASFGGRFETTPSVLHSQYAAHVVLIVLMMVATFIDFDEQTIPDAITISGAVIGLLFAALLPDSRLLVTIPAIVGLETDAIHLASGTVRPGHGWPAWLDGPWGLGVGLLCFAAWWLAVLPWTWTTRRGLAKAVQYFVASLRRRVALRMYLLVVIGAVAIVVGWKMGRGPTENWESLLSALVGLACGGGLVWSFRIVGTRALGQEAMGFGDVTLMAMIGTFTGWQPTLLIFFLAPAAAVLISISQWMVTGSKVIAFGPYLCLATLFTVVRWDWLWEEFARHIFLLGWFVPAMMATCIAMTWALLILMRFVREAISR